MAGRLLSVALAMAVSITACSSANEETSTLPPPTNSLTLRPSGLGIYDIGEPASVVIDGVSSQIGGWDADSTEASSSLDLPDCGVQSIRLMSWGILILIFAGEAEDSPFLTWSYGFDPVTGNSDDLRGLGLRTAEGVGLGTPRTELERIYRSSVAITDDTALDIATFTIDGDEAEHMSGRLEDPDPAARIQFLEREPACSSSG